jgi:hypothetical protein
MAPVIHKTGPSNKKREHMKRRYLAGLYSSVLHYLKAVEAAGTDDTVGVMARMKQMPINDIFASNGRIRELSSRCGVCQTSWSIPDF